MKRCDRKMPAPDHQTYTEQAMLLSNASGRLPAQSLDFAYCSNVVPSSASRTIPLSAMARCAENRPTACDSSYSQLIGGRGQNPRRFIEFNLWCGSRTLGSLRAPSNPIAPVIGFLTAHGEASRKCTSNGHPKHRELLRELYAEGMPRGSSSIPSTP